MDKHNMEQYTHTLTERGRERCGDVAGWRMVHLKGMNNGNGHVDFILLFLRGGGRKIHSLALCEV